MKTAHFSSAFCLSLLTALSILITGCQPLQKGLDKEDDRNPYFQNASKFVTAQNFHGAIQEYEKALRANPEVAYAHVEMGLLYLDKLGDPISAIYHFQQFLNARPNDSMREQLQTYIDKAKIDFAITLPNSTAQNADEFARLKQENVDLRQALSQTQAALAKSREALTKAGVAHTSPPVPSANRIELSESTSEVSKPATPTPAPVAADTSADVSFPTVNTSAPRAEAVKSNGGNRVHTIAPGDSLWKIARTYYPDNVPAGVKKIQEANPEKASDPSKLKLGVELIIP
ncbi:MAG: LysM peptidoglycan-binding domain-containing protein [Verrucomicrobiota bacterium]